MNIDGNRAMTLNQLHKQFADEDAASAWFERARRTDGPVCLRCCLGGHAYWVSTRDHTGAPAPAANIKGRGTRRPLVLVAAARGGKVDACVIPTHGKAAIAEARQGKLAEDSVVMTDGLPAYKHLGEKPTHLSVNHAAREDARTDNDSGHSVHVNTVERFNGMMRRAVIGVFHAISVKHLGRYASEASHRWNHRTMDVMARLACMVRNGDGRVLCYGFLTAGAA
jgi:transposase-like protein